jgi:phosphohistidine phosphatase
MKLVLVRHGKAVDKQDDARRPLAEKGRREVAATAKRLKTLGVKPARILHSGKTRAQETAEILSRHLAPGMELEVRKGLAPDDDPGRIAAAVAGFHDDTMIVGHMPNLERLAALLLDGDDGAGEFAFRTGGAACLELDADGRWTLQFLFAPPDA